MVLVHPSADSCTQISLHELFTNRGMQEVECQRMKIYRTRQTLSEWNEGRLPESRSQPIRMRKTTAKTLRACRNYEELFLSKHGPPVSMLRWRNILSAIRTSMRFSHMKI